MQVKYLPENLYLAELCLWSLSTKSTWCEFFWVFGRHYVDTWKFGKYLQTVVIYFEIICEYDLCAKSYNLVHLVWILLTLEYLVDTQWIFSKLSLSLLKIISSDGLVRQVSQPRPPGMKTFEYLVDTLWMRCEYLAYKQLFRNICAYLDILCEYLSMTCARSLATSSTWCECFWL